MLEVAKICRDIFLPPTLQSEVKYVYTIAMGTNIILIILYHFPLPLRDHRSKYTDERLYSHTVLSCMQ